MELKKGIFITFEGPEGSGKSTQINNLYKILSKNYDVLITKEPGMAGNLGQKIRKVLLDPENKMDPITEVLLYAADRSEHYKSIVIPALKQRKIILCDRSYDSTTAYQGYARGIDLNIINSLNLLAMHKIKPDITFLLDLPVEEGLARTKTDEFNKLDRLEQEALEFHKRLRKGYLEIAKQEPDRIKVVNVSQREIADITSEIYSVIKRLFENNKPKVKT